jgi:Domain of unknown function (DUF362)/Secretion system C-terminal sorting domain
MGLASLAWMLIRIIPKPSRAQYPCMRVAAPLAGSFIAYVGTAAIALLSFKRARQYFRRSRFAVASLFMMFGMAAATFMLLRTDARSYAFPATNDSLFVPSDPPNSPVGIARGIFPGRVVWMRDSAAAAWDGKTGYWWEDKNTRQENVDSLLSRSIRALTGESSNVAAWDTLFKSFNERHGKGAVGYAAGEKIAVKINLNQGYGTGNPGNLSFTSPHVVLALVRQLVYQVGVADSDITFYDTNRIVPDPIFTKCKIEFPGVHFMGWERTSGREKYVRDTTYMHWSQNLTMEINGGNTAYLPTAVTRATYLINLASFKAHRYVGVSFCSKNHFGTISADWSDGTPYQFAPHAAGLHCYVAVHDILIEGSPEWSFTGRPMGTYNALVDLMGHRDLGEKTLLFMIDALYGVQSEQDAVSSKSKWLSPPFNGNWTSSLFLSQDNVAIESVGIDFYRTEQAVDPNFIYVYGAVDNYLHEAAAADDPPSGTFYAPNGDGVRLTSLGVHEHWNNSADKEYTRNLGGGDGIELLAMQSIVTPVRERQFPSHFTLHQNYPNPFNPTTVIRYELTAGGHVALKVFDVRGSVVRTLVDERQAPGSYSVGFDASRLASGVYIYELSAGNSKERRKMLFVK